MGDPKRSFTIRVEHSLYLSLGQIAQTEGIDMNALINRLIKAGLGERETMEVLIRRLINNVNAEEHINEAA